MEVNIIVALIGLVTGTLGALIANWFQRKKIKAEAEKTAADADKSAAEANEQIRQTVMALMDPLSKRVGKLEGQLAQAMKRIAYLMGGIEALTRQIVKHGEAPCWTPDDWQLDD